MEKSDKTMTLYIYSNRHIKDQVQNIKPNSYIILENKLSRSWWSLYFKHYNLTEIEKSITYVKLEDYLNKEFNMGFDFKLGNPPYQGTGAGGNNKIYNQICKKTLSLPGGKYNDVTELITPISVLKKSKRFSLIGREGLNKVDLTTDDAFAVGVTICSWRIDKRNHTDKVEVINKNGTEYFNHNEVVFDSSVVDSNFMKIYHTLKEKLNIPNKRMFKMNHFGSHAESKKMGNGFTYPIYKMTKETKDITYYLNREPNMYTERKLVISMTRAFKEDVALYVGTLDFDQNYMFTNINDNIEIENIKSFIFSEYFITHSDKWKNVDGYGWNEAIKYLPPFDKTKSWTNEEVKEFIESFV